ncbi:MAG: TonB-dependent receptor plug domain-containing protein, partial [Thermoflexibacteraceae bacterium]
MKTYIYLPLVAIVCLSTTYTFAQNTSADTVNAVFNSSVQEILHLPVSKTGKVSVASNVITDQEKQPASVTTISHEQLRSSGARTLSEALMYFVPNYFAVEDQDDVIAAFRGLAADNNSKVLLLINGQNMNTEFFWGPPDAILNSADYDYIEKVEVIRGSGSVTLGQG